MSFLGLADRPKTLRLETVSPKDHRHLFGVRGTQQQNGRVWRLGNLVFKVSAYPESGKISKLLELLLSDLKRYNQNQTNILSQGHGLVEYDPL